MVKQTPRNSPNQLLKAERELRGWSQKYVADQIDADHYYLSRWERGTAVPSPYYRQKLCLLFGKNAKELGLIQEETGKKRETPEEQDVASSGPFKSLYDPAIPPLASGYRLIGRASILQRLKQQLFDSRSIALSALNGIPGVGKTSLALALANDEEVTRHFCDGILWSGLGPDPNVLSLLSHWGMLLGIASAERNKLTSANEWATALHAVIGSRKLLFVIDDMWKLEDALALKVGGPGCAYITTTRFPQLAIQFAVNGATSVEELNEDDSLALLAQLVPEFVASEPEEARILVRAVGGLPLALVLIGKYLRGQTYSGQLRRLQAALARLSHAEVRLQLAEPQALIEQSPSLPASRMASLENLIEVSDQQLDQQSSNALRALAVFPAKPNSFSEEAALAICNVPAEVMDTLSDAGLLEGRGPARYALHQTIADYARVRLTDTTVYERMARYYADYIEAHTKDFAALDRESVNIAAALQATSDHHLHADLIRGTNAFAHFLDAQGLFEQAEQYLLRARDVATLLQDKTGLTATLLNLGVVMVRRGDYTRAEVYLQEGLELARTMNHREYLVRLLQASGMLSQRQGKFQQAEMYLQEGLSLARANGDEARLSLLLKDAGTLEATQGNYEQAEVYLQEGLVLARQKEDLEAVSLLLLNLGQLASDRGNIAQAELFLQEALSLTRQLGHREATSLVLTNLGVLAGDQEDYVRAEQYLQEGLALARQIGYRERIGLLLTNLGWLASEQKNYPQAENYFQESLALAYQIGFQWLICGTLKFLGDLQIAQEQFAAAKETFSKVLEMSTEGNQRMKGEALLGLAVIEAAQGNSLEARKQGEASLAIFEAIGQTHMSSKAKKWLDDLPMTTAENPPATL